MPETQIYMATDELSKPDKSEITSSVAEQPTVPDSSPTSSDSVSSNAPAERLHSSDSHHSHRSHSRHSHRHSSSGSGHSSKSSTRKSKSQKSKKRSHYPSYRSSFWSRVVTPILQCRRCGERYRASWTKDTRCPKCGRHPLKVQPWESALYTLVFPAAIIGSIVHFGRSPRNAAITLGLGVVGFLVETAIYIIAR
jgi:hypothetical protein